MRRRPAGVEPSAEGEGRRAGWGPLCQSPGDSSVPARDSRSFASGASRKAPFLGLGDLAKFGQKLTGVCPVGPRSTPPLSRPAGWERRPAPLPGPSWKAAGLGAGARVPTGAGMFGGRTGARVSPISPASASLQTPFYTLGFRGLSPPPPFSLHFCHFSVVLALRPAVSGPHRGRGIPPDFPAQAELQKLPTFSGLARPKSVLCGVTDSGCSPGGARLFRAMGPFRDFDPRGLRLQSGSRAPFPVWGQPRLQEAEPGAGCSPPARRAFLLQAWEWGSPPAGVQCKWTGSPIIPVALPTSPALPEPGESGPSLPGSLPS